MDNKAYGFTIVELLIVIVVIAILAAISIVAYNSVSNNANDSAVKSDLANMAKKIEMDAAERGSYLPGGQATGDSTRFPGFVFKPSQQSYSTNSSNLFYCAGDSVSGTQVFRTVARSKSGNSFRYDSLGGIEDLGQTAIGVTTSCTGLDPRSSSYGYNGTSGVWHTWTNG